MVNFNSDAYLHLLIQRKFNKFEEYYLLRHLKHPQRYLCSYKVELLILHSRFTLT